MFIYTLLVEAAGTALLFWQFAGQHPFGRALYLALFHSISAFCNAGFCLFPDSLMAYRESCAMNLTVSGLIVLGGIGFPVIYELYLRLRWRKFQRRLSLHTRLVLVTSAMLIVAGAAIFAVLEETRSGVPFWSRGLWLPALFQSISARTAGFNTVDFATLGSSTLTFVIFLMFFGASPGSCGGGVKTTTLAVLGLYSLERLRGGERVSFFKRTIPKNAVEKAVSLCLLAITLILLALFALLVVQEPRVGAPDVPRHFLAYLFEAVSAFGTVGLSMGITAGLTPMGKAFIILLMLVGRVGVPTFTYLLLRGNSVKSRGLHYAEERIMLGVVMSKRKRFLVIGLGKFGFHVAKTLFEEGHEVIALDQDHEKVQNIADLCTEAIIMDATDKHQLAALAPEEMDAVVVSTGADTGKSILITLYLNELGAKNIHAKALDSDHGKILSLVGARELIEPERAMAIRLAQGLSTPNMIDFLGLEKGYSLLQLAPPRPFVGKTLAQVDLRAKFHVYVIAIKETVPDNFVMLPPANFLIKDSDVLVMVGREEDIQKVRELD